MAQPNKLVPKLSDELITQICLAIKSGAYEHVAAEANGVPRAVYKQWMLTAERRSTGKYLKLYQKLHHEVTKAKAWARMMAEIEMRKNQPDKWLMHGPGRETSTDPGWSRPAKATDRAQISNTKINILGSPEAGGMISKILDALAKHPEARDAVLEKLNPAKQLEATVKKIPPQEGGEGEEDTKPTGPH